MLEKGMGAGGGGELFVFRELISLAQAFSQETDAIHAVGSASRAEFAISGAIQDEIQLRREDRRARCPGQGKAWKHGKRKGLHLPVLNPLKSLREIFSILLLHKGAKMCLVF